MTEEEKKEMGRLIEAQVNKLAKTIKQQARINITSDVTGCGNVAKALGVNVKTVSVLISQRALGYTLWKNPTKNGNGKVTLTNVEAGIKRYRHWSLLTDKVKDALVRCSDVDIEKYYTKQGL